MGRKIYLQDIALDQAWQRWTSALEEAGCWQALEGEDVPVDRALGRLTAGPVWAAVSSPAYHASAMDGYAVRAADTVGATETLPLRLSLGEQAQPVNTGDPLPAWADAVVMIEHVQEISNNTSQIAAIELRAGLAPWTNVRAMGEDMVATELVLPANHTLRAVDLGAIAACGHPTVRVRRKPRVAILPTGNELITVEDLGRERAGRLHPGDIIEYNSIVLAAQVEQWGGLPTRWPIVADDYDRLKTAILEAAGQHDLVLVNAGSSAGSKDYTARVVEEVGNLLVHGVAVRPGHPVILGLVDSKLDTQNSKLETRNSIPLIGVPGYPVSCALTGEIFVEPTLARWLGREPVRKPAVQAVITRKLLSPMGDDEWVRVAVGQVGERTVAAPLSRGAGVITSLVRADGIVRIPRFSEGVNAGETVTVELYTEAGALAKTLVHIGSHDVTLDLLAQYLAETRPGLRLSSAHVGSLGGLLALRRGEAHCAGCHLIDPQTGEYNLSYVKQYLPGLPVVLVTLVQREQGLIVAGGNPKAFRSLSDLARPDVRFVNRQRGAGTRVLLDYRLGQLGLEPARVQGYEREEYTHLAVAAAVQSGLADCGLGIAAAAYALGLDFVPLEQERYDLVIPRAFYEGELIQAALDVIRSQAFRRAVMALPGYDTTRSGQDHA
ncbi:MAG: molybdopterin biosynthesis protein [Thermoflexales bacterium]|nr:molybdopterin biosynthesis protein [Thermoflexales bacterium]